KLHRRVGHLLERAKFVWKIARNETHLHAKAQISRLSSRGQAKNKRVERSLRFLLGTMFQNHQCECGCSYIPH
ncbi:PIPO, partial [Hippeastrum mosaic virus]|uniref:PIPO n=1 Tax=Hippeastrum mosaic virus TaxID=421010 RepID=UPI0002656E2F